MQEKKWYEKIVKNINFGTVLEGFRESLGGFGGYKIKIKKKLKKEGWGTNYQDLLLGATYIGGDKWASRVDF